MVRLYKALHATGVHMEITPNSDVYEVCVTFRHKRVVHKTWYNLHNLDEDAVIGDLYKFVNYTDCLNGDFVCC